MESDTILNLDKNALWSEISGLKSAMQKLKKSESLNFQIKSNSTDHAVRWYSFLIVYKYLFSGNPEVSF